MPFLIRHGHRFPVQDLTCYGLGNVSVWGLMLLMLTIGGCTEWTISPCAGTPFKTPCVGACTVDVEPGGPS